MIVRLFVASFWQDMQIAISKPPIFTAKKDMEDLSILLDILNKVLKIIKSTIDLIRTLKKKKE